MPEGQYRVKWEILVRNAENDPERVNTGEDIFIYADSIQEAMLLANTAANRAVEAKRQGWGSSGSYSAHVTAIVDTDGVEHKVDEEYVICDGIFTHVGAWRTKRHHHNRRR